MNKIFIFPNSINATHNPANWLGFAIDVDQFHGPIDECTVKDMRDKRIHRLLKALSPKVLRIGGGGIESTYITLDGKTTGYRSDPETYPLRHVIPPVELTEEKLDVLGEFCTLLDIDLMLSFPMRYEEDLDSAHRFIDYMRTRTEARVPYLEIW